MAADEKILVVVGIHEGKGLPPRPGYRLVVEARFAGESLLSDPVDHGSGGRVEFSTELAWEMTRKALQEHKLQRTPIKLVCLSISQVTKKKQEIGYILLDLKSAQERIPPQVIPWYGLLRCQYAGKRPELRISLTIEQNSSSVYSTSATSGGEEERETIQPLSPPPLANSLPPIILDQTNGWYVLGSPSPLHSLHTVSLTLSQPHNLHPFVNKAKGPYHFRYSLLGNDIMTEEFTSLTTSTDFHPERASVRIKTSPSIMKQLILAQPDTQISLCGGGGAVICSGTVPIKLLASTDSLSLSCLMDCINYGSVTDTPAVKVTLAIQQEKTEPTSTGSGVPPSLNGIGGLTTSAYMYNGNKQNSASSKVRRNLTQSLDEASGSIGSSTPSPSVTPPSSYSHKTSPTRPFSPTITTPTVDSQSTVKFTSPKTSPLLMSNSSPKSGTCTSHVEHGKGAQGITSGKTGQTSLAGFSSQPPVISTSQPNVTSTISGSQVPPTLVSGGQHISSNPPSSQPGRSILKPAQPPSTHHPVSLGNQPSLKLPDPPQQAAHSTFLTTGSSYPSSHTQPQLSPSIPQYTPSIPQYSFGIPQYIPMNPVTYPPTNPPSMAPPQAAQPTVIQQQMEYQAAMELEMWKMTQEQTFKKDLKEKEEMKLKLLEEEYRKRDSHREQLVKQKIVHYQSLEQQLEKTLSEVEGQRKRMKTRELELSMTQQKLNEEKKNLQSEVDRERARLKTDHTAKGEMERLRSKELTQQLERARKQILEMEDRLSRRNSDYDALREHLHNKSESRLQAELSLMQLEKKELEQKLDTAVKSKLHYKEQWSKALKEIAALKQREQTVMKDQLQKQQQELEVMRDKYLQAEEQQQLQRQIVDLRLETQRLQSHALSRTQPLPHPPAPPTSSSLPLPSSINHTSPHRYQIDPDTDIARWIEERNILLQTGVYTHSDPTIHKLDKKIREALVAKSSNEETSSY